MYGDTDIAVKRFSQSTILNVFFNRHGAPSLTLSYRAWAATITTASIFATHRLRRKIMLTFQRSQQPGAITTDNNRISGPYRLHHDKKMFMADLISR